MVELEEPAPHGTTDGASRRPDADSHDGASEPALGCTADSWRIAEIGHRGLSGHRREIHGAPTPASLPDLAHILGESYRDVAADFFVVPTVAYRLLFVLVLLAHDRRRIRHIAVTAHPTAAWTAQQLREAFPGTRRLATCSTIAITHSTASGRRRWGLRKSSRPRERLGKMLSSSDSLDPLVASVLIMSSCSTKRAYSG